jgi:hypothetical protein
VELRHHIFSKLLWLDTREFSFCFPNQAGTLAAK